MIRTNDQQSIRCASPPSDIPPHCPVCGEHTGPVLMVYGRHRAVFPDYAQACRAAHAALHPQVGGFSPVALYCAPPDAQVTHASLEDWLLA